MRDPTRREALISIAAGWSASTLPAQQPSGPRTLSAEDYDLLGVLVELILPASDTPGAREAGVHAILDEDLGADPETRGVLRSGFERLRESGFPAMTQRPRIDALTRLSEATGPDREFFETLKGLTLDAYYSTEVGLVQELGYRGNTYLDRFPGCTDHHDLEEGA